MAPPWHSDDSHTLAQWMQQRGDSKHGIGALNTTCISGDPVVDPEGIVGAHAGAHTVPLLRQTINYDRPLLRINDGLGSQPCSDVTPASLAAITSHYATEEQPCRGQGTLHACDRGHSQNVSVPVSVRCGYRPRMSRGVTGGAGEAGACPAWKGHVGWCWPMLDGGVEAETPPPGPRCYTKEELASTGWGYCPPCGDYRDLIKPRDPSIPVGERRMGPRYGCQDTAPCPEVIIPRACRKNRFTFCDWLATEKDREPPPEMRGCLPSLGTWCGPRMEDCCPSWGDPRAYVLAPRADL